jgi:hypothetical protein
MKNLTKEELQYCITQNLRLCSSVQPIERLKEFHLGTFLKYFSDKKTGFIWNRMNANGSWSWRWFENKSEAIDYMNGHTLEMIKNKRK